MMTSTKTHDISRRRFLRGAIGRAGTPIRPPWALAGADFAARCDRCGECVGACPQGVIRPGSGGYPETDFSARGCTLCGDCVSACGGKALAGDPAQEAPWDLEAGIGAGCLAYKGVVCRSCGEACGEGAIRFRLRVGGAAQPLVDRGACTGCGWCVGVCPVGAIAVASPGEAVPVAEGVRRSA
jgi:ferredoxin-type protein NapF